MISDTGRRLGSIGVFAQEPPENSEKNDPQVQPNRPVLDVEQVAFDPFFKAGVAPPAMDLGPSRDPRLDLVAQHVAGNLAAKLINKNGAFWSWAHQTHIPAQDIPELGKLVQAAAAQKPSEPSGAVVGRLGPHRPRALFGIHRHGTKLQDGEAVAIQTHPGLAV